MEKELLISKIKEKIGTTKISEQTMDAYVASILPFIANDEMVNDAFLEGCKAFLVAARGQMTNESAEEIRRYKENHPAPTPTPTPAPAPTPEPKPNNGNEAMEKLLKEFEDLKKSIGEDAKRRKQEQLMHDVMERMKAEYKEARGDGGSPRSGGGGGSSDAAKKRLDDYFARKKAERGSAD